MSIKYTERLAEAGIEPSVGSVGDSHDNALAETINGLYKAEVVHRREPWRTFEAVEFATLSSGWTGSTIAGFWNPSASSAAEAEERYFAMLNDQAHGRGVQLDNLASGNARAVPRRNLIANPDGSISLDSKAAEAVDPSIAALTRAGQGKRSEMVRRIQRSVLCSQAASDSMVWLGLVVSWSSQ